MVTKTVYLKETDRRLRKTTLSNYANTRDAASADDTNDVNMSVRNNWGGSTYNMQRTAQIWPSMALSGITKNSGKIRIYIDLLSENDDGSGIIFVCDDGDHTNPQNPPVVGDYDKTLYNETNAATDPLDYDDATNNAWNELPLTSTGLSHLNLAGDNHFLARNLLDWNNTAPTGTDNQIQWEQVGETHPPELELTYTVDSVIPGKRVLAVN